MAAGTTAILTVTCHHGRHEKQRHFLDITIHSKGHIRLLKVDRITTAV